MPAPNPSVIEVGGIRYQVAATQEYLRVLDANGTVLFSISPAGELSATTFSGAVTFEGATTFEGAVTFQADVTFEADVFMTGLPTADPGVDGQVYSNTNVLTLGVEV